MLYRGTEVCIIIGYRDPIMTYFKKLSINSVHSMLFYYAVRPQWVRHSCMFICSPCIWIQPTWRFLMDIDVTWRVLHYGRWRLCCTQSLTHVIHALWRIEYISVSVLRLYGKLWEQPFNRGEWGPCKCLKVSWCRLTMLTVVEWEEPRAIFRQFGQVQIVMAKNWTLM